MKRLITGILLLAAAVVLFTACGGRSANQLRMATSADFPPFEFINDAGEIDGFDVHMARAIADILGYELVIEDMIFDAVITAVVTGSADIGVAALSITPTRLETVDFTIPYFETTQVVLVRQDSEITTLNDLDGVNIAVQFGTTSATIVDWIIDGWFLDGVVVDNVNRYPMAPETIMSLEQGHVEAVIIDEAVAALFLADRPGLRMLDDILAVEEYAIAVSRDNPELTRRINDAIQQLKDSGEFQRIYEAWFGGQ
ncbi:MAG: basic amino acid ABC transporter substrate-binding protein [Clostridiales bacterium]|jgi:polar amino acid transport system substrate-binding protein|nr:basic amino acid ABC transporter substrate-binding protein [Clostridiales bacterium]